MYPLVHELYPIRYIDCTLQYMDCTLRYMDCYCTLWYMGCTLWYMGCTLWYMGCTLWYMGCTLTSKALLGYMNILYSVVASLKHHCTMIQVGVFIATHARQIEVITSHMLT